MTTKNSEILVTGSALHGKLGIQNISYSTISTFRKIPFFDGKKVESAACGDFHTMCCVDGVTYAFGGTLHKKLGGSKRINPHPI